MQPENRVRVTTDAFLKGDVYIDYPYEKAKFRFEMATLNVYRRWYGEPETEISHSSDLYNESHSGGWKITREDYFRD